jgi:hypothetical protein
MSGGCVQRVGERVKLGDRKQEMTEKKKKSGKKRVEKKRKKSVEMVHGGIDRLTLSN